MRKLTGKLETLRALKSVLSVWRVLAVNRYRAYRSLAQREAPYFHRLRETLEHLFALHKDYRNELLRVRQERSIDLLILSTDKGYVGDFDKRLVSFLKERLESAPWERVKLFLLGERILPLLGGLRVELKAQAFARDIDWESVNRLTNLLVHRFKTGLSDALYLLYHQPLSGTAKGGKLPTGKRYEKVEETPFFYPSHTKRQVGFIEAAERGDYAPRLIRLLPAKMEGKYSPSLILNFEGNPDKIVDYLLSFYINFSVRHLCVEHFSAVNFARFRTISRILKNIESREMQIQRQINKLRQERINRELLSFANALLAYEDKTFRDLIEDSFLLKVDERLPEECVSRILERFSELEITEVVRSRIIGGFILKSHNRVLDASVKAFLERLIASL